MIKLILTGLVSFLIAGAATFAVMVSITPPVVPEEGEAAALLMDTVQVVSGKPKTAAANTSVVSAEVVATEDSAKVDSLLMVIVEKRDSLRTLRSELKELQARLASQQVLDARVKELAKTFESMKAKEMKPILQYVDDSTARLIYENMSGRSRKKLLLALEEKRAAQITNEMAKEPIM